MTTERAPIAKTTGPAWRVRRAGVRMYAEHRERQDGPVLEASGVRKTKGRSSVGRAADSKSAGREFESLRHCSSFLRSDTNRRRVMADNVKSTKEQGEDLLEGGALDSEAMQKVEGVEGGEGGEGAERDDAVDLAPPTNLGATKYVHAAFFVVGIAVAFITGRIL